jgi:hypothetical protein
LRQDEALLNEVGECLSATERLHERERRVINIGKKTISVENLIGSKILARFRNRKIVTIFLFRWEL